MFRARNIGRAGRGLVRGSWLAAGLVTAALAVTLSGRREPVPPLPDHRPFALNPGPGPLTIVALGTSLTARADWPSALASSLSACGEREVRVVTVAQPGAGSDWGRGQVGRVAALAPALVLVEFTINDADLGRGRRLANAETDMVALLDALARAAPQAQTVLMTMSPAFGPRGWIRPWLADHEAAYRQLVRARGIGLIDLAPLWRDALAGAGDRRSLLPDGLHPTPAAVATVALPTMRDRIAAALPGCPARYLR